MGEAIGDVFMTLITWALIVVLVCAVLAVLAFMLGFSMETQGTFRCRRVHPKYKTRCALKSGGHLGVPHRDRRGRAWW